MRKALIGAASVLTVGLAGCGPDPDMPMRQQSASADASRLAEALEGLESLFDKMEHGFSYPVEVRFAARDAAREALREYKEGK